MNAYLIYVSLVSICQLSYPSISFYSLARMIQYLRNLPNQVEAIKFGNRGDASTNLFMFLIWCWYSKFINDKIRQNCGLDSYTKWLKLLLKAIMVIYFMVLTGIDGGRRQNIRVYWYSQLWVLFYFKIFLIKKNRYEMSRWREDLYSAVWVVCVCSWLWRWCWFKDRGLEHALPRYFYLDNILILKKNRMIKSSSYWKTIQ